MPTFRELFYFLLVLFGVGFLYRVYTSYSLPPDPGDGIQHFFYAQAAFDDPIHLLNHWAKPLFTLLSAPFAQWGFSGMVLFNLLIFILTCYLALRLMKALGIQGPWPYAFPLLLLISGDYVHTVVAGLTEPLFNLFLILGGLLLVRRKWVLFAIALSFTPFLRSEGQLIVILGGMLLLAHRQWRSLPFLVLGFLLYGLAGRMLINDFWWYFHNSPYEAANAIYGKGNFAHYFISYRNYLDNAGLFLLLVTVVVVILPKARPKNVHRSLVFFGVGSYFGILGVHVLLYGLGIYGAAGLTRLATQGLPLFFVVLLHLLAASPMAAGGARKAWLPRLTLLFMLAIFVSLLTSKRHQEQLKPWETALASLSNDPLLQDSERMVYYHHPLVPFMLGGNPFQNGSRFVFYQQQGHWERDLATMPLGSLLVWDAQFGPQEMALPLSTLQAAQSNENLRFVLSIEDAVYVFEKQ